jgi:hypothetical protein
VIETSLELAISMRSDQLGRADLGMATAATRCSGGICEPAWDSGGRTDDSSGKGRRGSDTAAAVQHREHEAAGADERQAEHRQVHATGLGQHPRRRRGDSAGLRGS